MGKNFESGHAVNVENFEKLKLSCVGYGVSYNPTKVSLTVAELGTKYTSANNSLIAINPLLATWKNEINARESIFNPIRELCTRILNAVETSDVSKEFIKDVKTYIRKLQGKRATPKIVDNPETPEDESAKSISASQMSFDNRIENMDKLIELLKTQAAYIPNETKLTTASLTTLLGNMRTSNTNAKTAYIALSNARIDRDKILYHHITGLVTIAEEVKKYVKSVYGALSLQYKQISGLKFVNFSRRK